MLCYVMNVQCLPDSSLNCLSFAYETSKEFLPRIMTCGWFPMKTCTKHCMTPDAVIWFFLLFKIHSADTWQCTHKRIFGADRTNVHSQWSMQKQNFGKWGQYCIFLEDKLFSSGLLTVVDCYFFRKFFRH